MHTATNHLFINLIMLQNERITWLDTVRLAAMFTVVMCHCADPFNFYPGPPPPDIEDIKWWGAAYGSALRPCVPLFVMLTGALLLPVRQSPGPFYKKRISRVLWPFLIWSVLYNLFPWIAGLLGQGPEFILNFFPYSGDAATSQDFMTALRNIAWIPFNFSPLDVHMWYIYLLIGLYLYMPIFSAWVEKASERSKLWFLCAWGITLFIPYFKALVDPYVWGACSWNEFYALYYFAGFNGYLLLGHYLRRHQPNLRTTLLTGIPLFAAGWLITFAGFRSVTQQPEFTAEEMELFFYYCSPNVVMMTVPLFLLCARIPVKSARIRRLLANLTTCGFGIYMVHYFFAGPSILLVRALQVPVGLQILVGGVLALAVSWALVALLRRVFGRAAVYLLG